MNADIHIKKADFRFWMDSEEMAFGLYASWSSFYESAFVHVVEKVLEHFNPSGQLLSIGTLELDLGSISRNEFYSRFPLLLEEKLEELMQRLMLTGTSREIKKVSKNFSFFEAVGYYLIHGYYPWSTGRIQKKFSVLFIGLLSEYAKEMCEFLRAYGHYSSMRRRLVIQLEDAGLQQLVRAVNPAESNFIIAYFNLLINEHTCEKIATSTVKEHRDACWEVILAYLLVQKAGHFNRREFIGQTIRGLAAHYGLEYIRLLHFLTDVVLSLNAKTSFHSEFNLLLTELNEEVASELSDSDHSRSFSKELSDTEAIIKNRSFTDAFSAEQFIRPLCHDENFRKQLTDKFTCLQLRELSEITEQSLTGENQRKMAGYYFALMLDVASEKEVEQQLKLLKQNDVTTEAEKARPDDTEQLFVLLKQPQSRRRLIRQLNEKQLHGLVKKLVPGEERFVISYAEMLDRQNERNAFEGRTGGEFKLLKWEFILTVLTEETGSTLNRKTFVFSVISMLAAHYNLSVYDLLRFVYQTLTDRLLITDKVLADIIGELYFEEKEKKGTRNELNLFDQALKDEFYWELVRKFIQTGTLSDETFIPRLYDILEYLLTYRPGLSERLTEELKKGFLLTDLISIPKHKSFYRRLILFVVRHYRLNLPGGQKIKSLFENIAEDRFRAVPVTAYKTMLSALLLNDTSLYQKAWKALTDEPVRNGHFNIVANLPDEQIISLFFYPGSAAAKTVLIANSRFVAGQIFSSRLIMEKLAETCRIDNQTALLFPAILQQLSPWFIYRKLIRLYPFKAAELKLIFRWMATSGISLTENTTALFLANILILLASDSPNFLEKGIGYLPDSGISATVEEQLAKSISRDIQVVKDSSLQEQLKRLLLKVKKHKPAGSEAVIDSSADSFIEWLIFRFGAKENPVFEQELTAGNLFHPLAYSRFEQLLIRQPELVRKQIDTGILPKYKISQWLRSAPGAVQLRWMQAVASPYHRQVLNDAFLLLRWIQETIAGWSGVSFNRQKALELLLEFSSGKNQNSTEKDLFNTLLNVTVGQATDEQWQQLPAILKTKAVNRGKRWEQKTKWLVRLTSATGTGKGNGQEKAVLHEHSVNQNNTTMMNEEVFISNAGLVLCNPFLPRLFSMLELTGTNSFKDVKSTERAVLLLQYLLSGNTTIAEHELVLNKLLCGLDPAVPVDCIFEVVAHEAEIMQQMLQGMIQHWGHLGNTSPKGLVDSFLIRGGKLEKDGEGIWHLKVEAKGYDVLLDSLPWSYSPVKYSWMDKPLYVRWR